MSPSKRSCGATGRGRAVGEHDRAAGLLLRIVDAGLAGSIFLVPMLLGGRHALGRLALVVLAVAAALAWVLHQWHRGEGLWRHSAAQWLLLAGGVLLVVQLAPLPAPLLKCVSPHISEILPLWQPNAGAPAKLGVWSCVSLTPGATRAAMAMFIAYSLLFLVTVQRIQATQDVERLLRWCALSALVMASFGLVQLVTANGKFFWFYEHPFTHTYRTAKGAFASPNHFAHFLALGVGPLIWWVQEGLRRRHAPRTGKPRLSRDSSARGRKACQFFPYSRASTAVGFRLVGLGVVLFAVLLSLSRGGALATLLAVAVSLAVCYRAASIGPKLAAGLGAAALLIGVGLSIFGHDRVADELGTLTTGSLETVDAHSARRTIWGAVVRAIPDFPWLGSGVGSHREVYPMYLPWTDSRKYYSHAECGYLQVALETGMAGLSLLLTGVAMSGYWCVSGLAVATSKRTAACLGAVSASLAASAAHSVIDFVWYIPGCMAVVAMLAACALRLRQLAPGDEAAVGEAVRPGRCARFSGHASLIAIALLLAAGAWSIHNRLGPAVAETHWDRFLLLNTQSEDAPPLGFVNLDDETAAEQYQSSLAAKQQAISELRGTVRWEPEHARAHLELAEAYLRLFHQKQQTSPNVMSVADIRDAVLRARSEAAPPETRLDSRKKLDAWLSVAVGKHYRYLDLALTHARRALRLCPLLGEGYLLLGELCFLEGGRQPARSACLSQALAVRPYSGDVLFCAGAEAVLNQDWERGLACWREAFRRGPVYQRHIIDTLTDLLPLSPGQKIDFFLDAFEPDLEGLRLLERRYQKTAQPGELVRLRQTCAAAVEAQANAASGPEAAELWLEAMTLYRKLNDAERRLACGQSALCCDPNSLRVHEMLADCLADLGQFDEAETHFKWLMARKPHDSELQEKLKNLSSIHVQRKRQIASPGRSTGTLR